MSMLGVEQVMSEMEAVLQAGMTAKAAALNAEYTDDVDISAPETTSYLRMLDPEDRDAVLAIVPPAVIMRPLPEEPDETVAFGDEYQIATPVEVSVVVGYDTAERQQTRLLRYLRAVKELLGPENVLDCGSCRYAGGGFAREWTTDNGVLRDVAALFVVTVFERP